VSEVEIGDLEIIEGREQSSMSSSWSEYLCLERKSSSTFELSIRGYEFIGEIRDYSDEDGEENLPDQIDGKTVVGTVDEYVVGGNLVPITDDQETVEFSQPDQVEVIEWLKSVSWSDEETKRQVGILWKLSLSYK
jgi:hypothetical protein